MLHSGKGKMAPQDWTRDRVPSLSRGQPAAAVIVCILLMAIVWIVFGQTVRYSFVNYDDQQYVYRVLHAARFDIASNH